MRIVVDSRHASLAVVLALAAAAGAVAGCAHSTEKSGGTAQAERDPGSGETTTATAGFESHELTVVDGKLRHTTWALGNWIYGFPSNGSSVRVRGPVHSPLAGTYSAAAAASPANDRLLAYNSFARKRPVLRLYDAATDEDVILDEGTYSLAWRTDGALAYFKGLQARVADPSRYRGHVVVRSSPEADPVRWTTKPGRFLVAAWAGNALIVHKLREDWPKILVFDAPGRPRVLAERAALVALSPDGSRATVAKQPRPAPALGLVDIATGNETAVFAFSDEVEPIGGEPVNYVADSGAWTGDSVIAAVTNGVAVFRVRGDELSLEELLTVDPAVFPLGLLEPKTDESGRYFAAMAELQQRPRTPFARTGLVECNRVRRRCVFSRTAPAFQPPRVVYNASRP